MTTANMSPFAQKASDKEGEDFEIPPPGLHPAVLIALIDLGTHTFEYQGKSSDNRKIFLVWELTAEHNSDGETFLVAQDYTWSLHKKANFRRMLEAWSGRTFQADEEFDPLLLIGKPCMVNVTLGLSAKQKKFTEIMGVMKPPKGTTVPPKTREEFVWHLSMADVKQPPPIPEWIPRIYGRLLVDDIKASHEWKELERMATVHAAIPAVGDNGADDGPAF